MKNKLSHVVAVMGNHKQQSALYRREPNSNGQNDRAAIKYMTNDDIKATMKSPACNPRQRTWDGPYDNALGAEAMDRGWYINRNTGEFVPPDELPESAKQKPYTIDNVSDDRGGWLFIGIIALVFVGLMMLANYIFPGSF